MTLITGTFKNSGQVLIASGVLRVQLNAPLTDELTSPDSVLTQIPADFDITSGVLETCDLKESETDQVSYTFTLFESFTDYDYYYAGTGEFYARNQDRPSHLHTDSKYYTGVTQSAESLELERVARPRLDLIGNAFQAIVPNISSVDFAQLQRSGFSTDRLPQSARQVAAQLKSDPTFTQSLIDFLVAAAYDNTRLYQRGNIATVSGSAYQCLANNTIGKPPASNPTEWILLVSKGNAGGTGGDDTAYAPSWNGVTDAPSKNAVYDKVETLAPLASPAFTGNPTLPTQVVGTSNTTGANCAFVAAEFNSRFGSPVFTGNPTVPTQDVNVAIATNGARIANMEAVKNSYRYSRLIDSKAQGTNGGSCVVGINTRDLNTIVINAGDVVTLTSNTFTLRAGTYVISARGQLFAAGTNAQNRIFLWNVTGSARLLNGSTCFFAANTQAEAQVSGRFTLSAQADLQIRHYSSLAAATNGFGIAANESGQPEIYVVVELWRID